MVLDCRTQMEASTWTGFTEEEKAKIRLNYENSSQGAPLNVVDSSSDVPGPTQDKIPPNLKRNSRNLKMKLDDSIRNGEPNSNDLPPEALLVAKPKPKGMESPNHVKLKIIEDTSFEIVETKTQIEQVDAAPEQLSNGESSPVSSTPVIDLLQSGDKKEKIDLDHFKKRQKLIEEQNRLKKEMLAKALTLRKMKTQAEAQKLQQIQEELSRLDASLSNDVAILRGHIEIASAELAEAEKRYVRAEREFIEAKQLLFGKRERKELLTEHLCTIIEQNEMRKAHRLTDLMVQLSQQDQVTDNAFTEMVTSTVTVDTSPTTDTL